MGRRSPFLLRNFFGARCTIFIRILCRIVLIDTGFFCVYNPINNKVNVNFNIKHILHRMERNTL